MMKFLQRMKFMLKFWKFIPFLKDFFLSKEVELYKKLLSLLLIFVYAIFPFDLIPDFIAFFGVVDDFVIITFILERMLSMAPEPLKQKHGLLNS